MSRKSPINPQSVTNGIKVVWCPVSEQGLLDPFLFLRSQSHTNILHKFWEHFLNTINSSMCCLKCSWWKSNKQGGCDLLIHQIWNCAIILLGQAKAYSV